MKIQLNCAAVGLDCDRAGAQRAGGRSPIPTAFLACDLQWRSALGANQNFYKRLL